jgi:hypothetical protein
MTGDAFILVVLVIAVLIIRFALREEEKYVREPRPTRREGDEPAGQAKEDEVPCQGTTSSERGS